MRHDPRHGAYVPPRAAYTDEDVAQATERLRAICATLPEVTERVSHGAVTFFVRGKRSIGYLTPTTITATAAWRWCAPPLRACRSEPDWDEVAQVVNESYRCVAPKTLVRRLAESTADRHRRESGELQSASYRTGSGLLVLV